MQVQVLQHCGGFTGSARVAFGDVLEADSARLRATSGSIFLPTEFEVSPLGVGGVEFWAAEFWAVMGALVLSAVAIGQVPLYTICIQFYIRKGGISGFYSQDAAFSTVLQYLQPQKFFKNKTRPTVEAWRRISWLRPASIR